MLYQLHQAHTDLTALPRAMAQMSARWLGGRRAAMPETDPIRRRVLAACELIGSMATSHARPPYEINTVEVKGRTETVTETVVMATPFASLVNFGKPGADRQPKVLVVAPMSGHFATLLRGTVQTMLPDNNVYLTDWHNGREIPLAAGPFDLDDFTAHIIRFLEFLGAGCHVVAVCQPTVAVLAAVALMAQDRNPAQPASMTLMAGPIDTRRSPTAVNDLACVNPIEWFETKLIAKVPWRYKGAGRRVYPGFLQLTAFMAMNLDRHKKAFRDYFDNIIAERDAPAQAHKRFYDEYFAVMDLPAEFYLQTIAKVFQRQELAHGTLEFRGRKVEPRAIRRTAILTVEGELDDICGIGQTMAALDLCTGLSPALKNHHLQTGVGHYGVFNGRRWAGEIYPKVREMIQTRSV